ncbi:MAG: hypothetical protein KBD55_01165 [Candidatus Pacebacteria bacterium]|jgi:CRISPR-associated protein Csx3|nr:hypothetical protein [Candidatus Paceibacterota bacterium]
MKTLDQQAPTPPLTGRAGLDLLKASSAKVAGIRLVDLLKTPEGKELLKIKKIILAGPPRSGKSCLRQGLKDTIRTIPDAPYPLFITGCPDGEGAWFQEAMNNDPALAAKLKAEYKSKFTPEFVSRVSEGVKNLSLPHSPLNFIDIGGVTSPENEEICKYANGAVLLCGESATKNGAPAEWKAFFAKLGIPVIAEVYSDYHGKTDIIDGVGEDGVFRGSVHHLERGENLSGREAIQDLAKFIVNLGEEQSKESNLSLMSIEQIKERVDLLIEDWQKKLPQTRIVLGGSLVSGLFILDEHTKLIDVDVRFLTDGQPSQDLIENIENVTGLKYRKTIAVEDWPQGTSEGYMIEGQIKLPDCDLPLDIEGCLRNNKYVGWARFYQQVLTPTELVDFLEKKKSLRDHKVEYKALKKEMIKLVIGRCIERGLVDAPQG